jgi:hypothetical protein
VYGAVATVLMTANKDPANRARQVTIHWATPKEQGHNETLSQLNWRANSTIMIRQITTVATFSNTT